MIQDPTSDLEDIEERGQIMRVNVYGIEVSWRWREAI